MAAGTFRVQVLPGGAAIDAAADTSVLKAAEQSGVIFPSSCRNGTCRTCITHALEGTVRYGIDWPGLSAEEKTQGWILPCVAYATSDLQLDAPAAFLLSPPA